MNDILAHTEDGITTLTFNRLDKKNALTAEMYTALAGALRQADADPATRVIVVQGHETVFCAGNDIKDFLEHPPTSLDAPVFHVLRALAEATKPLVAAVCGPAVGIGTTMLLHCDLVYAGDNAAFAMPFVNLGICPEAASSLLAPLVLGPRRASEALLLGEPLQAEAALELGLVNRVLPPGEVNAYAHGIARKLAAKPRSSLFETKRLMKAGARAMVVAQMEEEGRTFGRMLGEAAAKEAFGSFLEKRKPDFSRC